MANVLSAVQNTVSITLFNRGQAGRIFSEVKKFGARVVMKNNAPECVLISPEEYTSLMDEVNDARLLILATERLGKYDPEKLVSQKDMDRKYGFSADDLKGYEEVEIG